MKKYKITDKQRKMLTEFIGECWHDIKRSAVGISPFTVEVCSKCKEVISNSETTYKENRTFTNDSDMMEVRKMLRDEGLWHGFYNFVIRYTPFIMVYLYKNPERFCWLVAKFLEERRVKHDR